MKLIYNIISRMYSHQDGSRILKIVLQYIFAIFVVILCMNSTALVLFTFACLTAYCILVQNGSLIFVSLLLPAIVLTDFLRLNNFNTIILLDFCFVYTLQALLGSNKFNIALIPKSIYILFGSFLITLFYSTNVSESIWCFSTVYIQSILFFIFSINLLADSSRRLFFEKSILILIVIMVLHSFYQFTSQSFGLFYEYRDKLSLIEMSSFSKIKYPSFFAASYVASEFYFLTLPFIILKAMTSDGINKILAIIMTLFVIAALVLTQQRSGLLIMIIIIFGIVILANIEFRVNKIATITASLLTVSFIIMIITINTDYGRELSSRIIGTFNGIVDLKPETIEDSGSAFYRLMRLIIGWEIFTNYPLFGSGLGTSAQIYPNYGWNIKEYTGGAHNLYVFLLSETGIIGFLGFIIFWGDMIRKTFKNYLSSRSLEAKKTYSAFLVFELAVLVDGLFSGLLVIPSLLFIFTGLAYIVSYDYCKNVPVNNVGGF